MNEPSRSRLARMHDVMAGYVERGEAPGLVTLVAHRGDVHVDAVGAKSIGGGPVGRDTIFRISSMTKPITAVAAMILIEQCTLRLDDPVDDLLPELADRRVLRTIDAPVDDTVPANRSITMRDLLTFRLGFGGIFEDLPIVRAAGELQLSVGPPAPSLPPEPDEWMHRFGTLPLMYQPGERWMYHTGADLLGVLIARASGRPFETFLRERIFEPLGMKDTGFHVPVDKLDRFTACYGTDPQTGKLGLYDDPGGQWSTPPAFPSGGAGLVSTADDFFAFGRMMLGRGERLLSRTSIDLMTTDQLTVEQKAVGGLVPGQFDNLGWGLGIGVVTGRDSVFSIGTFGWDGGMGTSWQADPREGMTGVLMTSAMWTSPDPPPVCRDFWTLAYSAIDD